MAKKKGKKTSKKKIKVPKKKKFKTKKLAGEGVFSPKNMEFNKTIRDSISPANILKQAKQDPLKLKKEREIASDFAIKVYERFGKIIKSIVLFGSSAKNTAVKDSDVDIIIIIDDCTVQWDDELVAWYRQEMAELVAKNKYRKSLHVNTVRLSTWWEELIRGEPVVLNVIRYGETLIDFGGFFNPLKVLMAKGKLKSTNEAIFVTLQRAPIHMARSRAAILGAIEGLYWAMVDSAHAALISAKQIPPSPEHVAKLLQEIFVKKGLLNRKYASWYEELYVLAHKIFHGEVSYIEGKEIDEWRKKTDKFIGEMANVIDRIKK